MHHQYHVAGREFCKTLAHARDLFGKALAARRSAAGWRGPELMIGSAKLAREIVMSAAGPVAKILFAKIGLRGRPQSQCGSRCERPDRGAAALGLQIGR